MKRTYWGLGLVTAGALLITLGTGGAAQAASNTWLDKQTRGHTGYGEPATSQALSRTGVTQQVYADSSALMSARLQWGTHVTQGSDTLRSLSGPRDNRQTHASWALSIADGHDPGTLRMRVTVTGLTTGMRVAAPSTAKTSNALVAPAAVPTAIHEESLLDAGIDPATLQHVGDDGSVQFWRAATTTGGVALVAVDGEYVTISVRTASDFNQAGLTLRLDDTDHSAQGVLLPDGTATDAFRDAGLQQGSDSFFVGTTKQAETIAVGTAPSKARASEAAGAARNGPTVQLYAAG